MSITFEEFLKNNSKDGNEFRLVVNKHDGVVEIYCHPSDRNGETYDAYVRRGMVSPKKAADNLLRRLTNGYKNGII